MSAYQDDSGEQQDRNTRNVNCDVHLYYPSVYAPITRQSEGTEGSVQGCCDKLHTAEVSRSPG